MNDPEQRDEITADDIVDPEGIIIHIWKDTDGIPMVVSPATYSVPDDLSIRFTIWVDENEKDE